MTKVFISYRRDDSAYPAGEIYKRLAAKFGRDNVFKDVDSIPLGVNFKKHLDGVVKQCAVELVLIGRLWLDIRDEHGNRRLDDPADFVRIEIESALSRDIPVIPVLLSGATMPKEQQLPTSLAELTYRNATSVRPDPDFDRDVERLIVSLEHWLTALQQPSVFSSAQASTVIKRPTSLELMPQPFAWMPITAGKVTLEEGGYVPEGGQSFEVPAFHMAKYPITNAQFAKFIEVGGYKDRHWWTDAGWEALKQGWERKGFRLQPTGIAWVEPRYWQNERLNKPDYPVVGVSWHEAIAFSRWISDITRELITLPTEAQWQRAAQGDTSWAYPYGPTFEAARCNSRVGIDSMDSTTSSVIKFEGKGDSPFKVVDMSGNVTEWCLTDYETGKIDLNDSSDTRVVRGGSFTNHDDYQLRVDYRYGNDLLDRSFTRGFRISLS